MFFASLRNLSNERVSNSQLKEAKITVMSCVLKQNFHTLGAFQTRSETQMCMYVKGSWSGIAKRDYGWQILMFNKCNLDCLK